MLPGAQPGNFKRGRTDICNRRDKIMHGLSSGLNVFRLHFDTGPWPSMKCKTGRAPQAPPNPSSLAPAYRGYYVST